jgi:hypothetical protein
MANPNQSRYLQAPRKGYDENNFRRSDGAKKITGVRSAGSKYADLAGEMEDAGVKIKGGQITPTEKFGTMAGLASEQRNPLSRGSRAGSISTLGQPLNSMYAANPDFFRSQIAQRNAPATAESVGAQRASIQTPTAEVKTANVASPTGSFDASLVEKRGFPGGRTSPTFGPQGLPDDTPSAASSAARGMAFKGATTGRFPSGASVAPSAPSQMDMNRQALEQGAAGIRLRREALGQSGPADSRTLPSSRVAKTETGYKVVTDAKGNIVGTNAPIKPISSAVGNFADQRAAFNRGEGTAAEKSALGPNIREAALAELSKSAPKVSPAQSRAQIQASSPMGPPLQGSAQMGPPLQGSAQMGPPLQGSAQMGPPLQGSAQMGPPAQAGNIGRIAPSGGVPKMFESAPSLAGPPSNMARPIQGPPNASATTPYERMQQTTLGPATPNGPPLSTSKPPSMLSTPVKAPALVVPPTKDDIRKQRTTLARR